MALVFSPLSEAPVFPLSLATCHGIHVFGDWMESHWSNFYQFAEFLAPKKGLLMPWQLLRFGRIL